MISVAVGIIMKQSPDSHRVLLCQRKASARYGLKWEFPGGKLENGESSEECLRRELREELGIEATVGELFHQQHAEYPDSGSFDVFYYVISGYTGEMRNNVFETISWVPVEQLSQFDILEGNRDVIQKLLTIHAPAESRAR
jgi:8-oxo-dGTP diphosphatase